MAYTPPTGSSITFSFPTGTYTPPTGNAITFSFNVATGVTQETIAIAGQVPSVTAGYVESPTQEAIATAGQTPSLSVGYSETPGQGTVTTEGQASTPGEETVIVAGQTPTLTQGYSEAPTQGAITVSGGIPGATLNEIIIIQGQTPTLTIGQSLTPTQADIAETLNTAAIINGHVLNPAALDTTTAGQVPSIYVGNILTPAQLTVAFSSEDLNAVIVTPLQGAVTVTGNIPTFGLPIVYKPGLSGFRVTMILIGGAGPTLRIPISSLSGLLSADTLSSLTVTIPRGDLYAAAILDEINYDGGSFKIETTDVYVDGSTVTTESEVFAIDTLRQDRGARGNTLTLRGTKTLPASVSQKIQLEGVSYVSTQANGKTRIRARYDATLVPGDLAVFEDSTLAVAQIYYIMGQSSRYMEVTD